MIGRVTLTWLLICVGWGLNANPSIEDLKQERDWTYQSILINDQCVLSSEKYEQHYQRYIPIKELLKKYTRPIKVLDLGANNGFFGLLIAADFDATVVSVDMTER